MGLAPYLVTTIDHIQDLQPDNFKKHYPLLKQFFLAVGAGWITQDEEPEPLSAANERIDSEVSYLILAKTHEDYRTKLTELSTACARWKALKDNFITRTHSDRLIAFQQLITIDHNIKDPIVLYTTQVSNLCMKLARMDLTIPDDIKTCILLARLNPGMYSTRKDLVKNEKFPSYEDAAACLRSDAHDNSKSDHMIKVEDVPVAFGLAARIPSPPSEPPPQEAFAKGFRWCSPRSDKDCFRCGREGHRAQFCLADMPQAVRDWILNSISRREQALAPAPSSYSTSLSGPKTARKSEEGLAAQGPHVSDDDSSSDDEPQIPWEILDKKQRKTFKRLGFMPPASASTAAAFASTSRYVI
ncbi:CCHC-type domain-containing protein [Mycena indigotica]|uniref:CCHC-type domain-containing protein n=1 Tax=Mycena indigotica TaxID=2126181 RepID=A0A8H6SCG0_9AGAR|nr:CCHC-type domain-containing protein [Mycena indigotica]KAF7296990.1 CCHC-type domain-containing protein [Mycena indigotica]